MLLKVRAMTCCPFYMYVAIVTEEVCANCVAFAFDTSRKEGTIMNSGVARGVLGGLELPTLIP